MMKVNIKTVVIATALAMTALTGCSSMNKQDAPAVSPEGMDLVENTRSTVAYQKPGIDWSEYTHIYVKPSTVAFKKNWQRDYNRDTTGISGDITDKEVLKIKEGVASLFDETFTSEFMKGSKYTLVDEIQSGTLVVTPAIINLDVNAPDIPRAGMVKTYVDNSGSATLYLEVHDAVSGEILARIVDSEEANDKGYYQWSNRVTNRADAKIVIKGWASKLHKAFSAAQLK